MYHVMFSQNDVRQLTLDQVDDCFRLGLINENTLLWAEGMTTWETLREAAGLTEQSQADQGLGECAAPPPPSQRAAQARAAQAHQASARPSRSSQAPARQTRTTSAEQRPNQARGASGRPTSIAPPLPSRQARAARTAAHSVGAQGSAAPGPMSRSSASHAPMAQGHMPQPAVARTALAHPAAAHLEPAAAHRHPAVQAHAAAVQPHPAAANRTVAQPSMPVAHGRTGQSAPPPAAAVYQWGAPSVGPAYHTPHATAVAMQPRVAPSNWPNAHSEPPPSGIRRAPNGQTQIATAAPRPQAAPVTPLRLVQPSSDDIPFARPSRFRPLFQKWVLSLSVVGGGLVVAQRNDYLLQAARAVHQESAYLAFEHHYLGGVPHGTPRAVQAMLAANPLETHVAAPGRVDSAKGDSSGRADSTGRTDSTGGDPSRDSAARSAADSTTEHVTEPPQAADGAHASPGDSKPTPTPAPAVVQAATKSGTNSHGTGQALSGLSVADSHGSHSARSHGKRAEGTDDAEALSQEQSSSSKKSSERSHEASDDSKHEKAAPEPPIADKDDFLRQSMRQAVTNSAGEAKKKKKGAKEFDPLNGEI